MLRFGPYHISHHVFLTTYSDDVVYNY